MRLSVVTRPAPRFGGFFSLKQSPEMEVVLLSEAMVNKHVKQQFLHRCSISDVEVWLCQTDTQPHLFW